MFRRTRGFTLIELLVVVGIIGLLAALLLPVFLRTREQARSAACLSNYHQIGLAIHQYAGDSDGATPPDGGSFSGLIADCLLYTQTTAIFACADDFDRVAEHRAGTYRMASLYQGLPLVCGWADPYDVSGKTLAQPTTTTLAYEAEKDFTFSPILPTYRHHGGTQLLRFDGHTRWLKGISLSDADG